MEELYQDIKKSLLEVISSYELLVSGNQFLNGIEEERHVDKGVKFDNEELYINFNRKVVWALYVETLLSLRNLYEPADRERICIDRLIRQMPRNCKESEKVREVFKSEKIESLRMSLKYRRDNIAHSEYDKNIEASTIKFLKDSLTEAQKIVNSLSAIINDSEFAYDNYARRLKKRTKQFWKS